MLPTNSIKFPFSLPYNDRFLSIIGTIILCVLLTIRVAIIFSYTPEITGIDNNFVYGVARLLADLPLYSHPESAPYLVTLYPPLYYSLCYLVGKLVSIDVDNAINVYFLCRAVALICDVFTVFIFYKILNDNTLLKKGSNLLITSFFSAILSYLAYTFSRCDSLFLSLYALLFYNLFKDKKGLKHQLILGIICVAGIFSKQNGIILPILVLIWYWLKSNTKDILFFVTSFIILMIGTYFFFKDVIGFSHLELHNITALNNRIDFSWFYVYIFKALGSSLLFIPLYAGLILAVVLLINKKQKYLNLVYIVQFFFSLSTSLKFGSTLGYFNESYFLSFIIISVNLSAIKKEYFITYGALLSMLPLFFIFFIHTCIQNYLFFINQNNSKKAFYNQQISIRNHLRSRLSRDNYILDLSNPNRNFFKVLFYDKMLVPNFDVVDCCTLPDSSFNYRKLKANLIDGTTTYIIKEKGDYLSSQWGVDLSFYKKDTTIFGYDLYKYPDRDPNINVYSKN